MALQVTCNIITFTVTINFFYNNNLKMTLQFFIMVKITSRLEQLLLKNNLLLLRVIHLSNSLRNE